MEKSWKFKITAPVMKYGALFYFILLFTGLAIFYGPSFSNPPRSDYWSALYVFQAVDASPAPPAWTSILTFDLWKHGTYRPFSHLLLYFEHRLFQDNFLGNHLLNFFMYCLSIFLLYHLAGGLGLNRVLTAAFLTLYAFLFSHFDIVTWTFQLFSTMSFSAALLAFILYLRFLKTTRRALLFPVGLLFLFSMLCSEVYFLWPLALLWLTYADRLRPGPALRRSGIRPVFSMLGLVYAAYFFGFYLSRAGGQTTGAIPSFTASQIFLGLTVTFFNFFYNGIGVAIIPLLNVPARMYYNIEMGGLLSTWHQSLPAIVRIGGGIGFLLILGLFLMLIRSRRRRTWQLLIFFLFLGFTNFFITALARLSTNYVHYSLVQFRYQYVPNAMLILMAVVLVDILLRPTRREKIIISLTLLPILIFNMYVTRGYVMVIKEQLEPLRVMLSNIRRGIDRGMIDQDKRLYISDGIVRNLPSLCWNRDMARFMKGNYQWIFSPEEVKFFSPSPRDAAWIITENEYRNIYPVKK